MSFLGQVECLLDLPMTLGYTLSLCYLQGLL